VDQTVSGLQQPGINLGGLLNMSGMSGAQGSMSGGTQAGTGAAGMPGGMDLAELLQMLSQGQEAPGVGMNQSLGGLPVSVAQQQAMGDMTGGIGGGTGGYMTAGAGAQSGDIGSPNLSADPLALAQKFLGLAQKGVNTAGLSNTSLLPSPTNDTFDPTGQMQQEGYQSYRAGEMQDYSGLTGMLNNVPAGYSGLELGPAAVPGATYFTMENVGTPDETLQMLMTGEEGGGYTGTGLGEGTTSSLSGAQASGTAGVNFNPTAGNTLGLASGALGLAGGIQNQNPYGIAGGSLGTAASLANMLGYTGTAGAIGGLGGPLSLAAGAQSGDPQSLISGTIQTYNTLATLFPETFPSISSLLGDALISVAPTVAAELGIVPSAGAALGTLGADAGIVAGATGGGVGAGTGAAVAGAAPAIGAGVGLGAVGLVAALGPIFNMLFKRGGPLATDREPTSGELYQDIGARGVGALERLAPQQTNLDQLTRLLNTSFAPHGEVQMGSAPEFGWAGDYDDPASANWLSALGALRNPDLVNSGMPWVDPFVRGLWVKSGQTGIVDTPSRGATYDLQRNLTAALPDLPAYAALKQSWAPGGDLFNAQGEYQHGEDYRQAQMQYQNALQLYQAAQNFQPTEWQTTLPLELQAALAGGPPQAPTWSPYVPVAAPAQAPPPITSAPDDAGLFQLYQQLLGMTPSPGGLPLPPTTRGGIMPSFAARGGEDPALLNLFQQYGAY